MTEIVKIGGATYKKISNAPVKRRIRYKRQTRYGSFGNRNARQRANLAEDKLKEIRFRSKLQKEKRQYDQDRKALRKIQKQEAKERRQAFFNKIRSGASGTKEVGHKVYNANISNPFAKRRKEKAIKEAEHNQQVQQQRQKNFRNAFETTRES